MGTIPLLARSAARLQADNGVAGRALLYLLIAVALLPLMMMRDFLPTNELRYLSIAEEALREGHLFAFYNHGVPYADKPPLYLWLVMAGRYLFGSHAIFYLSLLQLVPAIILNEVMVREAMRGGMSARESLTATATLFSCGLFAAMIITLRMDMLMALFIVLALATAYGIITGSRGKRAQWLLGLWVFLAVFSKGPMGFIIPVVCIVAYSALKRNLRACGACLSWRFWTVLLAGCAAWWTCVWIEGGPEYINNLLFHQTVGRAVNSFHHKEPFYYYFLTSLYSFQPWTAVVFGSIAIALVRKLVLNELQIFMLTVIAATYVTLSCVSSKIEVYLLPVYPFVVYLGVWLTGRLAERKGMRVIIAATGIVLALALPAFLTALSVAHLKDYFRLPSFMIGAGVISVAGVAATMLALKKNLFAAMHAISGGIFIAVFVIALNIRSLNPYVGYSALSEKVIEMAEAHEVTEIEAYKLKRPENMDIYLKKGINLHILDSIPAKLTAGHLYILPTKRKEEFVGEVAIADSSRVANHLIVLPAVAAE